MTYTITLNQDEYNIILDVIVHAYNSHEEPYGKYGLGCLKDKLIKDADTTRKLRRRRLHTIEEPEVETNPDANTNESIDIFINPYEA